MWIWPHLYAALGFTSAVVVLASLLRQKRTPASMLAWILAVALIPYVGLPLYLMLGNRKMRRLPEGKKASLYLPPARGLVSDPSSPLERLLSSAGAPRAVAGNAVELLPTGEEAYRALIGMLGRARRSIHITTFILGNDDVACSIVDVLAKRASEGIEVRLLIDALFRFRADRRGLEALRRAGGRHAFFMPVLHIPFRGQANLRNHRKLAAVDGQEAIMGGMNLAREYLGPEPDPHRWRDIAVRVEGPVVTDLENIFRSDWALAAGELVPLPNVPGKPLAPRGAASMQVVASGPDVAGDTLYDATITALFGAQRRVWIATPYFIPDEALARALVLAVRRGVDVRIVVPARSNHWTADLAGGGYLREVQEAGGHILPFLLGMMHAKVTVIDDTLGVLGSANMDMRSLFLDYEVALFFYSRAEVELLASWFYMLFSGCGDRLRDASRTRALFESVGRLLAPLV